MLCVKYIACYVACSDFFNVGILPSLLGLGKRERESRVENRDNELQVGSRLKGYAS